MQNMKDGLLFTYNEINLRLLFFQFLKDKKISESLTIKYFPTSDFLKNLSKRLKKLLDMTCLLLKQ